MSFLQTFLPHSKTPENRPVTNELLPDVKDNVFRWQIDSHEFARLDEESLLRSEVATHKSLAKKILQSAHKIGMIDSQTGRPDTTKVTRNMVNDMPVVGGISKQRELVMLLFFWEEEIRRWESLDKEEQEIKKELSAGSLNNGPNVGLEESLRVVRARKRILPSQRDLSGNVIGAMNEQLPEYVRG